MPGVRVQSLQAAIDRLKGREIVPTSSKSAIWEKQPPAIKERILFMSRVNNMKALGELKGRLLKAMEPDTGEPFMDRGRFALEMQQVMRKHGLDTGKGGLSNPASARRLRLVYDHQMQSAYEYAKWEKGQSPSLLAEYPAQEFLRVSNRKQPRPSQLWRDRWRIAGGRLINGRMVALKNDPVWTRISRFGTPYPPYDFGSGMGIESIDRDEAESLGLLKPGEPVEPDGREFMDDMQVNIEEKGKLDEDAAKELKSVFGDKVSISGSTVAWVGEQGETYGRLYDAAMQGGRSQEKEILFPLKKDVADRIRMVNEKYEQWNLENYTVSTAEAHTWHTHERHGVGQEERSDQVPLTREDFLRLPVILQHPDGFEPDERERRQSIRFTKTFLDGKVFIAMLDQRSSKTLVHLTAWKKKPIKKP